MRRPVSSGRFGCQKQPSIHVVNVRASAFLLLKYITVVNDLHAEPVLNKLAFKIQTESNHVISLTKVTDPIPHRNKG